MWCFLTYSYTSKTAYFIFNASNAYYETNILTINTFVDKEIISSIRNKIIDIDVDNPLSYQIEIVSA